MLMLLLKEHTEAISENISRLRNSRYKIFVVCGGPLSGKTTLVKNVCRKIECPYIDVTSELLPVINKPVIGAFGPNHLIRWIGVKIDDFDQPVCFDELEPLISTFGKSGAIQFFEMLKTIETKNAALITTRLESIIADVAFPREHLYFLNG
jgi:hypothetical protein